MQHDPLLVQACAWRDRFDALVAERMRMPFAWGAQDCCLWAADCVLAVSRVDPAVDLRGTYTDAMGAGRLLDSLGGLAALGARAGLPIGPLQACVGDVGLVGLEGRETLAVCAGELWLAPAADGLAALPFDAGLMAWRVVHA